MEIAIRDKSGRVYTAVNELQILHVDLIAPANGSYPGDTSRFECGFLDENGNFLSRDEVHVPAVKDTQTGQLWQGGSHQDLLHLAYAALGILIEPRVSGLGRVLDTDRLICVI